jgi:hypothetical protein
MAKKPESSVAVSEPKTKPPTGIVIVAPKYQTTQVKIVGITPLICNAVPQKLLNQWQEEREQEQIRDKGGKKQKTNREARNYEEEYRNSIYPIDGMKDAYGFPAIAFKHAMVGAVRQVNGLDMTTAKRLMFVHSDGTSRGFNVVRIIGKPEMRRDMVRLKNIDRTPDIRFRGGFFPWAVILRIEHNIEILSQQSLLNLLLIAGRSDGVGENRPSSGTTGDNGTFRIAEQGD